MSDYLFTYFVRVGFHYKQMQLHNSIFYAARDYIERSLDARSTEPVAVVDI